MMNKAQLLNKENWLAYLERANEEELTRNAIANDIVAKIAEAISFSDKLEKDANEAFLNELKEIYRTSLNK
jgi:hypothetical protein